MAYASNADIPADVQKRYSDQCQTVWREAWNADFERAGDEKRAFAVAETAADNCMAATKSAGEELVASAVKFVAPDTIEGPLFQFGRTDLTRERFTRNTDFCLDWFGKSGRPTLYDHGLDPEMGPVVVGRQTEYEDRGEAIWAQSQLDRNMRYRKAIDHLIDEGALGYSGGAMPHLATKDRGGNIKRFPWVEQSLTPIPAEPGNLGLYYVKNASSVLEHLEAVELDVPAAVKAALTALDDWADSSDSDDGLPDGLKFADLVDRLSVDGPAWVKARLDWHAKSGRVLSAATRDRLATHPSALRQLADDLDELLSSADAGKSTDFAELIAATSQIDDRLNRLRLPH